MLRLFLKYLCDSIVKLKRCCAFYQPPGEGISKGIEGARSPGTMRSWGVYFRSQYPERRDVTKKNRGPVSPKT
jgi:hypothetical protein